MDPVQKALWYVESHLQEPISLEEIAAVCHVSPFHLTRAFAGTMGLSLMRYVRARRLSEAARQLAHGADDILSLALVSGYGSHEAFTRAFRDQFGLTPEQLRAQGHVNNIPIVEAITMSSVPTTNLTPPRFESLPPLLLAGLAERYTCQLSSGIPNQWQRFAPHLGNLPGQRGTISYGVKYDFDNDSGFDYLCAVEVAGTERLPAGLTALQIPAQRYAVFTHTGHVAGIRATFAAIWSRWFPQSGCETINAPSFERYGPEFNPATGMGGFEIWIPVRQ